MKSKLAKIMAVLTVAGLMAVGPVAYAALDNPKDGTDSKQGKGNDFFKDLNLTPEQTKKIEAQREARKENSAAMGDVKIDFSEHHDGEEF